MPTVAPSGDGNAPAVANNDGGTILRAGNIAADSKITRNLELSEVSDDRATGLDAGRMLQGSEIMGSDLQHATNYTNVTKAANQTADKWILRGVTTEIAGSGNDVLLSKGSDVGQDWDGIHENLSTYQLGSMADAEYDVLSRPANTAKSTNYTKGTGAGTKYSFVAPSGAGDVTATDDAATPTRAVPGELTYNFGELAEPTTDEYKAKDSAES